VAKVICEDRAKALYPPQKRKGRRQKPVPLRERIRSLDFIDFINVMGPWTAMGVAPFKVSDAGLHYTGGSSSDASRAALNAQFQAFAASLRLEWRDIANAWFQDMILGHPDYE